MEKQVYITEEEREKCHKVVDVFAELYEIEDERSFHCTVWNMVIHLSGHY